MPAGGIIAINNNQPIGEDARKPTRDTVFEPEKALLEKETLFV